MMYDYYIASPRELPIGKFGVQRINNDNSGVKKTVIRFAGFTPSKDYIPLEQIVDIKDIPKEQIEEFNSFEDASGLYVEAIEENRQRVKHHFKNKFVYQFSAVWGKFVLNNELKKLDYEMYKANRKCINELFNFIRNNSIENDELEIYSCWVDEEGFEKNRNLCKEIDLKLFTLEDSFNFKDREYIIVKC